MLLTEMIKYTYRVGQIGIVHPYLYYGVQIAVPDVRRCL